MMDHILQRLKIEGVEPASFQLAQIVLLPENMLEANEGDALLETTDMNIFAKTLRKAGVSVFTLMDVGIDLAAIDRRSGDRWLGTVWIRDKAILPAVVSVIAGLIVLGVERATTATPHSPEPSIHVEIIFSDGAGGFENLKYKGDGATLLKILGSIKNDNSAKD